MENAVSPLLKIYSVREALNLAERETLLYRLGSELNRTVFNSCGNPIRGRKHVSFQAAFLKRAFSIPHQKRSQKRKLTIFGNTKQVIQDYDTAFDNSIPFRKNDPLRIEARIDR